MNVLAKGLSNSSDLEQMNLAHNQIFSNESIRKLTEALIKNQSSSLQLLDLTVRPMD